jgi:uncharacterized tellurite resistance protein B-like protein
MKLTDLVAAFKGGKTGGVSHMKNLIEMAAADGQVLESEKELLKTIAKHNGISESQLADIQNNPAKVQLEVPRDPRQKFHQLFDLVKMMGVDNHVHANETELAKLIAIKFGYRQEVARELVDVISQNIKNGSTADEAMKRAQLMIG